MARSRENQPEPQQDLGEPVTSDPKLLGELRISEANGEVQGIYKGKGWIREHFAERFLADVPPGEGLDEANYFDMGRLLRLPTGTKVEVEISFKVREVKDQASE